MPSARLLRSERGASELVGYILLVGMVLGAAVLIVALGSGALGSYQTDVSEERTLTSMQLLDSRLSSLGSDADQGSVSLDIGPLTSGTTTVERRGNVTVVANGNSSCRETIPLTSIRTQSGDDVLVHELGGLWRSSSSGTAMVSPPAFTYENGTLNLRFVNVSGRFTADVGAASQDSVASNSRTAAVYENVFNGSCSRPQTVTVRVKSDLSDGWADYLEESMPPGTVSHTHATDTVEVTFGASELPAAFDMSSNDVVDLTNSSQVSITNNTIEVAKNGSNQYRVVATPLTDGSTVSRVQVLDGTTAYRQPMDVVFVLDESGSMGGDKIDDAKEAAKAFVGEMNDSFDRAGVVGYESDADYREAVGQYLSSNYVAVNDSVDDLSAGGATNIYAGIIDGTAALDLVSNDSRKRVIVLLSDGEATEPGTDSDAAEAAREAGAEAAESGVTVHTIGIGNPDEALMKDIANATGGSYRYVANGDNLSSVFTDLFAEIADAKHVVREPISMGMTVGTQTVYPRADGNDSHIANVTIGGEDVLNVNDPTAPGGYSYLFTVNDSRDVTMNAYRFNCTPNSWVRTGQTYQNGTSNNTYAEARCTDIEQNSTVTVPPTNATILHDGDDLSNHSTSLQLGQSAWWEDPLTSQLSAYLNGTTLHLPSNEAIIVYNYPGTDGAANRFVVRYQIGRSVSDVDLESFLQLRISEVELAGS